MNNLFIMGLTSLSFEIVFSQLGPYNQRIAGKSALVMELGKNASLKQNFHVGIKILKLRHI